MKVFIDKHLLATVFSVVVAIVTYAFLPSDFWIIEKLGKSLYLIEVAGVAFLAIKFVHFVFSRIQEMHFAHKENERAQRYEDKEWKEIAESYRSFVDRLSPDDRALFLKFIKTNNQPIMVRGSVPRYESPMYGVEPFLSTRNSNGSTSYKLADPFYQTMKTIYEKTGSISHFNT